MSRSARRRRRGRHSWRWADRSRARARPGTGGWLRTGKGDDGWLAADEHTDPNRIGIGRFSPGGFLRGMDGALGFEAAHSLKSLGARRTVGVAVHPHRGQLRFSRPETSA